MLILSTYHLHLPSGHFSRGSPTRIPFLASSTYVTNPLTTTYCVRAYIIELVIMLFSHSLLSLSWEAPWVTMNASNPRSLWNKKYFTSNTLTPNNNASELPYVNCSWLQSTSASAKNPAEIQQGIICFATSNLIPCPSFIPLHRFHAFTSYPPFSYTVFLTSSSVHATYCIIWEQCKIPRHAT